MLSLFDKVLSALPGSGWKTQFGWLLTVIPVVIPTLMGPAEAVVQSVGQVVLAVGVLHKAVKELKSK